MKLDVGGIITIIGLFMMWFVIGFSVAMITASSDTKEFMKPFDAALAKCEMNLPRNQGCVLVYEAKVKE